MAATSRHLAAVEAVLLGRVRHTVPDGERARPGLPGRGAPARAHAGADQGEAVRRGTRGPPRVAGRCGRRCTRSSSEHNRIETPDGRGADRVTAIRSRSTGWPGACSTPRPTARPGHIRGRRTPASLGSGAPHLGVGGPVLGRRGGPRDPRAGASRAAPARQPDGAVPRRRSQVRRRCHDRGAPPPAPASSEGRIVPPPQPHCRRITVLAANGSVPCWAARMPCPSGEPGVDGLAAADPVVPGPGVRRSPLGVDAEDGRARRARPRRRA